MLPPLDHVLAMTDDTAIFQHAVLDVPNRAFGYCTDDVSRALIVACDAANRPETANDGTRLFRTYLAFLHHAQLPDGWFHNVMAYDRTWEDERGSPCCVGRAIWALGYAERFAPREAWRTLAARMLRRALGVADALRYARSHAFVAFGLAYALGGDPPDAAPLRRALAASVARIVSAYDRYARPGWRWCEEMMCWDNARLCEALLRGGALLGDARAVDAGLDMLDFYAGVVIEPSAGGAIFVPIGNDGWYRRGGMRSRRGQQPLEAAALVGAALAAHDVTGEPRWAAVAEIAHAWYAGRNTHGVALARPSGGCCDGLDDELNANMGAESTLSYLMSASALAARRPRVPLAAR